ncbi:MAG: BamA/TamA family outer membrane protein [Bacteroidetes bacterium]|nr:BamA/TamA family outer membrane protein [Bacteroidota bacterium]
MLIRFLLLILLTYTGLVSAQTETEPAQDSRIFISRVDFEGVQFFNVPDLADGVQTKQNSWFLAQSIKPGLFWYRTFDWLLPDTKISFFAYLKNYLKNNFGEPPAYFWETALADDKSYLETYYRYFGFFRVKVDTASQFTPGGIRIRFLVSEQQRAEIKSITYELPDDAAQEVVQSVSKNQILTEGQGYSVFDIRDERNRILNSILELGYSFTTLDSISVIADTTHFPAISVRYQIRPSLKTLTARQNLYIYTNRTGVDSVLTDTLKSDGFKIHSTELKELDPGILIRHIELEQNRIYSPQLRLASIRNLTDLGVFNSVTMSVDSVVFQPEFNSYQVFPNYQLRMSPKHEIRPEVRIDSRSDGSFGSDLIYSNKNIFHSAENLRISVGGSVQLPAKWTGVESQISEWNMNGGIDLNFPYFWGTRNRSQLGFRGQHASKRASLGNDVYQQYYLTVLSTGFRVQWKHATYTKSFIDLLELNWVKADKVYFTSQGSRFIQDPYLNSVFRWTVQWTNTDVIEKNYGGIQEFTFEESGILPRLIAGQFDKSTEKVSANGNTGRIFGLDYYQYSKIYFDHRQYIPAGKNETVAIKLFGGYIFPYGVSRETPPLNRFFGGGITSLRAWAPTALGPGSVPGSSEGFYDIKLEGSLEYRKKWSDSWGYALFIDYGNLWSRSGNPGAFTFSSFWKEIAVDYGFGLRYFLPIGPARLDFAWKAYDPANPAGERWIPNTYRLNDFSGFISQMSFYIGIGHSF